MPGKAQTFLGLGQYNERPAISVDAEMAVVYPELPHSWSSKGRLVPNKDFFGFTWDMDYFHLAAGVPTLFQVVFRVEKKGGYVFGPDAAFVVEVDASTAMDAVKTEFSRLGALGTADLITYVYGYMKPVLHDKSIYVGVHLDFSTVGDGNGILFAAFATLQQFGSYIVSSLEERERSYGGELGFSGQIQRARLRLRERPVDREEAESSLSSVSDDWHEVAVGRLP